MRRSTNKKHNNETYLASIAPSTDESSTFGDMEAGDNGCASELDHVHRCSSNNFGGNSHAITLVATHMSL